MPELDGKKIRKCKLASAIPDEMVRPFAPRLDILGMQAFKAVADCENFRTAAGTLNISQTALSHRLRKFEDTIGVELVARTTRRIELTKAGAAFLPRVRQALYEVSSCINEMRALGSNAHEFVSFGCLPAVSSQLLPSILGKFRQERPKTVVRLFDRVAPQLIELLLAEEIEFGITILPLAEKKIKSSPLLDMKLVAIFPKDAKFVATDVIRFEDITNFPLIRLGANDIIHALIEDIFPGRPLHWQYQVQHAATAIRMVAMGLGTTILPDLIVDARRDDVVSVPIDHPGLAVSLGLIELRNKAQSPAAAEMIAQVEAGFQRQKVLASRPGVEAEDNTRFW